MYFACVGADYGIIEHWLRNIRDVHRLHMTEINSIMDENLRHRRLVELNVVEQWYVVCLYF